MSSFGVLDWSFVAVYFGVVLLGGWLFGRKTSTAEDFFSGGRRVPWPAVLLSITATEISAVTFLGVPGVGYAGDLSYLQLGIGSLVARFVVAFLFLGAFYQVRCISIYQFLGKRFGRGSQRTGAVFFLISRINASAIRLLLAAVGLSVFFGVPLWSAVLLFTGIALLYTVAGGIRAVIWTDCIQAVVFIGGGVAAFCFFVSELGWHSFFADAAGAGKLVVFHWAPAEGGNWLSDWNLFPLAFLNGLVMTTAALGCDQDLTQRMLTCRSAGRARWSVVLSGFMGIPVAAVFLLAGTALYFWVRAEGIEVPDGVGANHVFAWFIADAAPAGLRTLLLVGILATAMSSLDSALNALSSSVVFDLSGGKRQNVRVSRTGIVVFGVLLAGIALLLVDYRESFVLLGFKIVGVTYGSLLGVFLLGLLTRAPWGSDRGNLLAMTVGAVVSAALLLASEKEWIALGWTWIPILNAVLTFSLACCFRSGGEVQDYEDGHNE